MSARDLPQGSAEWLAARIGKVTASRVADVIAKTKSGPSASRDAYLGELVAERMTGQQYESFSNADMQRGNDLEPIARAAYEIHSDVMVEQVGLVMHPTIADTGASPDGLVLADGLVEIKCPRTHVHIDYMLKGKPPSKYVPQMAWQCACTGRVWCDFASFDPRMPEELQLFVVRYTPDPAYLRELEAEVSVFLAEVAATVSKLEGMK